jgi:hypothetical protein
MTTDYTNDPAKTKLDWVEGPPDAPPKNPPAPAPPVSKAVEADLHRREEAIRRRPGSSS